MRQRIIDTVDHFVDIRDESYIESARRIYQDRIDILVDLKGYTKYSRPQVLALLPAPVQVSYLGYPGTMGAEFINYILVDEFITPPQQQDHYTERFVYLPACYQINDRKRPRGVPTAARKTHGLPEQGFVFCCFNQTYKITPEVFAAWMRILLQVSGSVLWLLQSHPIAIENIRRAAAGKGVAPERILFAPIAPLSDHLARFALADLFLDTFPVNAHTTASDALWVGVPIVTYAGETFVSRVAGSLLHAVGLPELITTSLEEYEGLALRLAQDRDTLRRLRAHLDSQRNTVALFDSERFTRDLEAAYTWMLDQAACSIKE
jgi:predicted O-linked N-acetylglucosamine transferase (SPINDLY family)